MSNFTKNAKEIFKIYKPLLRGNLSDNCTCNTCEYVESEKEHPLWQKAAFLGILVGICLIGSCSHPKEAHAEGISTYRAVNAIIGEAENQGYTGMLAVACAIRNRGTLKGVYGEHAPRVIKHKYTKSTLDMAIKAWAEANIHDITHGATHWENIKAFGCPSWVKSCVEVFRHKDHVFYREVKS